MDIVVTARRTEVEERFRRHALEKLAKVGQLAPRANRLDVEVSHEANKRQASQCERIELTVHAKGPVIRAEACAGDQYVALDMALTKLLERLRRARDRKKVHHGRHNPRSVHEATKDLPPAALNGASSEGAGPADAVDRFADSPVVIREKVHDARPMTIDDALYEMELVGHDFFLFVDAENGQASVVYRRHAWSYGVIRLQQQGAGSGGTAGAAGGSDAAVADGTSTGSVRASAAG